MIEDGTFTDSQIEKCLEKFGQSETYKENLEKRKEAAQKDKATKTKESAIKANIEVKTFTEDDLKEAAFGKSFYAFRVDYSNPRKPKETRITKGDALCSYLGYTKALESKISAETDPREKTKNGFIVDTGVLFGPKKEPELYPNRSDKHMTKRYTGITCAKAISKDVEGTEEELKKRDENVVQAGSDIEEEEEIDKKPSKKKTEKKIPGNTPHGYERESNNSSR